MSKRVLTQQQATRIQQTQSTRTAEDGLVISRFGPRAEIETSTGARLRCTLRPHLDSIVAGDRIQWQPSSATLGVIVHQYPRKSLLARVTARGITKPIAANVTQLCIVVAAEPAISWYLLDSYLVMAELLQLQACILFNKADLSANTQYDALQRTYSVLGYPLIATSTKLFIGEQALKHQLANQTSVFVGQSGVGKSSLIRHLLPNEHSIKTEPLSERTMLGCHTTSRTTWYTIPSGGALLDSPGIRDLNLTHLGKCPIAQGFCEFRPFIEQCKFRNCNHMDAPGCAVLDALHHGKISSHRHKNYARMIEQFST